MKPKTALKVVLIISIAGLLFSGYLSYHEVFVGSCAANFPIKCGSWEFANLPACVYGFVMYLVVFIITLIGLLHKEESVLPIDTTKS